nr:immunoglobulin heavy chain junction region [Mus musculus]
CARDSYYGAMDYW